jgi:hypothetical protein
MPESMKEKKQKEQELKWFKSCREKCEAFPQETPEQRSDPAPDIVLPKAGIGVEITGYFQGQGKSGSPLRELESIQESIVKEAQAAFDVMRNERLHVGVFWVSKVKPTETERNIVVQRIVEIVTALVIQNTNCWRPHWTQSNEAVIWNHLGEIWINREPQNHSYWGCDWAGTMGDDVNRVQAVLCEKECKVAKYRKECRHIWLLIVAEGRSISSTFMPHEDFEQATFRTSFDRVFILDVFRNLVHEIRVKKQPLLSQ